MLFRYLLFYFVEKAAVKVYATGVYENARIELKASDRVILDETASISPESVYETEVSCPGFRE